MPPHAGLILCQGFFETQPVFGIGNAPGGLRNEVVEIGIAVGGGGRVCWIGRTADGCCIPVDGIDDQVDILGSGHERLLVCPAGRSPGERRESRPERERSAIQP